MSNHELDYFAFDDEPTQVDTREQDQPQKPPAAVAKLLNDDTAPELPPRRPYDSSTDFIGWAATNAAYKRLDWQAQMVGEAIPKAQSNGTVRAYIIDEKSHFGADGPDDSILIVADRDDGSVNEHGFAFDCISFFPITIEWLGGGDFNAGLSILMESAADTTPGSRKTPDGGHLGAVWDTLDEAKAK